MRRLGAVPSVFRQCLIERELRVGCVLSGDVSFSRWLLKGREYLFRALPRSALFASEKASIRCPCGQLSGVPESSGIYDYGVEPPAEVSARAREAVIAALIHASVVVPLSTALIDAVRSTLAAHRITFLEVKMLVVLPTRGGPRARASSRCPSRTICGLA